MRVYTSCHASWRHWLLSSGYRMGHYCVQGARHILLDGKIRHKTSLYRAISRVSGECCNPAVGVVLKRLTRVLKWLCVYKKVNENMKTLTIFNAIYNIYLHSIDINIYYTNYQVSGIRTERVSLLKIKIQVI